MIISNVCGTIGVAVGLRLVNGMLSVKSFIAVVGLRLYWMDLRTESREFEQWSG